MSNIYLSLKNFYIGFLVKFVLCLYISKKSPVSHTVPTRSIPDLPNIEKDLTESTGVVPAKNPSKVKSEESSNNVSEYEL